MSQEQTPGSLADFYRAELRSHFEPLAPRLTDELKIVAARPFENETAWLLFEVDMAELGGGSFPVCWFVMRVDWEFPSRSETLMEGAAVAVPDELTCGARYGDSALDRRGIEFETLVQWFGECWRAAGGRECGYRALIAHHDSGWGYDLGTMEGVTF